MKKMQKTLFMLIYILFVMTAGFTQTFRWTGGASDQNWNTPSNWTPPGPPTSNSTVIIPSLEQHSTNYPALTDNTAKAGVVTIQSGAFLDLKTHVITNSGSTKSKLIVEGILKLDGTSDQKNWFNESTDAAKIHLEENSTVEYYQSGVIGPSSINIFRGPYENLNLRRSVENTENFLNPNTQNIEVNKKTNIYGDLTIKGDKQTYRGAITAKNGSTYKKVTFTTGSTEGTGLQTKNITAGSITVNGNWNLGTDGETPLSKAEANGNIMVTGNFFSVKSSIEAKKVLGTGGNITVNTASKEWRCWGDITAEGNMQVSKMIASGGTIKILGDFQSTSFNLADYGTLQFGDGLNNTSHTLNIGGPAQIKHLKIESKTTLNLNSDIKINDHFENKGVFIANSHTVTLEKATKIDSLNGPEPTDIITITGTSTATGTLFQNLVCTNTGTDKDIKKLIIDNKIKVQGSLTLRGKAGNTPLTVDGKTSLSEIAISGNQSGGQFLKVRTNIPITGGTYTAEDSIPYEDPIASPPNSVIASGKPENWIFTNYNGALTWKGSFNSDWHNRRNWTPPLAIPGKDTVVTIPKKPSSAPPSHNYPKLTKAGEAKSITIDEKASLDLAGYVIKKGAGANDFTPMTSNGKLRMTGTSSATAPKGQKEWLNIINTSNELTLGGNSTIEYYGASPDASVIWEGPYQNLSVRDGKVKLDAGTDNLTVKGSVFVADDVGANFSISAGSQTYEGGVNLYAPVTFNSTNAVGTGTVFESSLMTNGRPVTFSGDGKIATKEFFVSSNTIITIEEGMGEWTSSDAVTVKTIDVKRNWTSKANVAAEEIKVDNTSHNNKWTASSGDITINKNLTAAQFDQTSGTLTFTGAGTPEPILQFTGTGDKNINNLTIDTGAKLKLGSDITIKGNFTNNGTFDAASTGSPPGYTVTLTNANHTITGTDNENNTKFYNLVCTGAGGNTITFANKISVYGNLTLRGSNTGSLLKILRNTDLPSSGLPAYKDNGIYINTNKCTTDNLDSCKWLDINVNLPIDSVDSNTYTCTAYESKITGTVDLIQNGNPKNWIFKDYIGTMNWKGSASLDETNWNNPKNWLPEGTPSKESDVLIPSNTGNKYPVLTANVSAKSVTVDSGASLDIADFVINDSSGKCPLTVKTNGTLRLMGKTSQKDWFASTNTADKITLESTGNAASIVEYYGASTDDIWGGPYWLLQTDGKTTLKTGGQDLIVYRKFTVKGSNVTIDTGAGNQTYSGHISAEGYDITFTTDGTRTVQTQYNVTAKNIIVTGNWHIRPTDNHAKTITAAGKIEVSKTLTAGDDASTGAVNIKLKGNFTADKFIQKRGTLIFEGTAPQQLTTTSSDSRIKSLKIESSAIVNLASDITITEKFENKGTFNAVTTGHTVTLEHGAADNYTIPIIGNDDKDKTKFFNIKCENAKKKTIRFANKVSVYGNLTLSGQGEDKENRLNLVGTTGAPATIYINGNKNSVTGSNCTYLGINIKLPIKSTVSEGDEYKCTVKKSTPIGASTNQQELIDGDPKNWIFEDTSFLIWVGQNSDWNDVNNWRPLPNHKPKETQSLTIRGNVTKHPILGQGLTPHEYYAKDITVKGDATLDLADKVIYSNMAKTATAKLEAKGTLKLKGTQDQKRWFEQNVEANKMTITESAAVEYYDNIAGFIWGNGTDGYNKLILNSFSGKTEDSNLKVNGDLTVKGPVGAGIDSGTANQTYAGKIDAQDGTNYRDITFTGRTVTTKDIKAEKITVNGDWELGSPVTPAAAQAKGDINVTGTWNSYGSSVTASGDLTADQFNQTDGILTFNGNGTPQTLTFTNPTGQKNISNLIIDNGEALPANNAKLKLASDITIKENFTNKGTFTADTYTVQLMPSLTITITSTDNADKTKFAKLQLKNGGGKNLTINGKIKVDDLDIIGTSRDSLLNLLGPGEIELTSDQIPVGGTTPQKGYYLNVSTNIPITNGHTYTVKESKPSFRTTVEEIYNDKKPENWIFDDCLIELIWVAEEGNETDKTKWDKPKNWLPNGIPGVHTPINILAEKAKYPKLESTTNAKAASVKLNGELDLDSYLISDDAGGSSRSYIDNQSLLKMTGTPDQKAWLELSASDTDNCIIHNSGSKIEYYGDTNNPVWDGPYKNLILGENRENLKAGNLTIDETLTVASNASSPVTITATTQTYNGDVTLQKDTTFNSSSGTGTVFKDKIEASGFDIIFSGTGKISTQNDITAKNISSNAGTEKCTSSGGTIKLTGDFIVPKFEQTGGTLSFIGAAQKLAVSDSASRILNLNIESSSSVSLLSSVTLISSFVNKGKFDAGTNTVTLKPKPDGTISITGTNNQNDTKFYNLFCEDAGDKTLYINNAIWVEEKMYLSGLSLEQPLTVTGSNGIIYLKKSHKIPDPNVDPTNADINNIRQKYLKVWPDNVKINDGKFYGTDESTDNNGTTKNKNGWVFYKTFQLVNSFAMPDKNEIYLLFEDGSSNNESKKLAKDDLTDPKLPQLIITDGAGREYKTKISEMGCEQKPLSISNHTFWRLNLTNTISPDLILDKDAKISLDYYGRTKQKEHISDIGINMVRPQMAFNSVILRSFDAAEDDPDLPRLDVRIPTAKAASSSNITLHFFSQKDAEHKFWHPGTAPIGPPPKYFALPKSGTSPYSYTTENNLMTFIISETDPYLQPDTVGSFMYVYDGWLPCARLRHPEDILSFDAWHFKIVGVRKQRGGVSIFNNVVNPAKGQEAIITPHLNKAGMLTIQIMTIDGNVVRTLERSYKAAGDHIYHWDGRNNGGNPVASGIYFVRIAGPEIDEMRKILVIK